MTTYPQVSTQQVSRIAVFIYGFWRTVVVRHFFPQFVESRELIAFLSTSRSQTLAQGAHGPVYRSVGLIVFTGDGSSQLI